MKRPNSTPSQHTRTANSYRPTSRPSTARPPTGVSTDVDSGCVVAVFESTGVAREVGIASLNRDTGSVVLTQLADCQTYVKSLHHFNLHPPAIIIVPDTFIPSDPFATRRPSLLLQYLEEEFPGIPIECVARKYWNESAGQDFINWLCIEEDRALTLVAVTGKYYVLSAASAVFKYAESKLNIVFAPHALRIKYSPIEGTMLIDTETTRNLELLKNLSGKKSKHTLLGVLDYTWTPMARRLLRVSILAPLTNHPTLEARLDAVDGEICNCFPKSLREPASELIKMEDRYTAVKDALKILRKVDLDKIISALVASESRETATAKLASIRVGQMLSLRTALRSLKVLYAAVENCKSPLLHVIGQMFAEEKIRNIEGMVSETLNDDATSSRGGALAAVNARVYAVKANHNRLLDVARESYKENVFDVFELGRSQSQEHQLPIVMIYHDHEFFFSLKKVDLEQELPRGFINIASQRQRWIFSSLELKKRNSRMKDSLDETLVVSDTIIHDLVRSILVDVGVMYKASEAVALLDMLWSLAHAAILGNYVRPEFTGTLAIKSGRHPILERVQSAGTFVANDVYACDSSSFQIVQGPNMSGKSTYLRQIALLAIMAMIGSFVPAEYASFKIHDSLLTRLSNDDDIERSLSTFSNEMVSSAMILGLATPDTLILIDELGRGTSPHEGIGISHAIAEALIELKPFVFFATHFDELTHSLSRHPSVVNLHLSVHSSRQTSSNFGMTFHYKLLDGCAQDMGHYGYEFSRSEYKRNLTRLAGLELARLADLPMDMVTEARRVAVELTAKEAARKEASRSTKVSLRRKELTKLRSHLCQALDHSTLPDEELSAYLLKLQQDAVSLLTKTMEGEVDEGTL